jgi:hypothetical protein
VKHLLKKHAIAYYAKYVDDIFIVFDSSKSEIQKQTENKDKNTELKMNVENNNSRIPGPTYNTPNRSNGNRYLS